MIEELRPIALRLSYRVSRSPVLRYFIGPFTQSYDDIKTLLTLTGENADAHDEDAEACLASPRDRETLASEAVSIMGLFCRSESTKDLPLAKELLEFLEERGAL